MLDLADSVDAGRRSGRASAVAMAARELLATYARIAPAAAVDDRDEWSEFMAEVRRAAVEARPVDPGSSL